MPVKKAAAKSLRQTKSHTERNSAVKIQLRYLVKHTRKAIAAKSASDAASFLTKAIKAYDKAAQNGVISKNLANRTKSRLTKAVRGIGKV